MNSKPNPHSQEDLDLIFLYVLQALPRSEMSAVADHISGCERCHEEMKMLLPVVESFVAWPNDLLRPPQSLWDRLAQRIAEETGKELDPTPAQIPNIPEWEEAAPGVSVQLLSTNAESQRVAMVVRLAPGSTYPPHRHAGVEELYLLAGVLIIDEKTLYPGDYVRADAGSIDHRVWTRTGCTCLLLTSTEDEIR